MKEKKMVLQWLNFGEYFPIRNQLYGTVNPASQCLEREIFNVRLAA
jgi:hypothetical protein